MDLDTVFAQALHIFDPWFIKEIRFDPDQKRLDIDVDFKRGSKFKVVDEAAGLDLHQTAYDTVQKQWRHLNFFEHECYLNVRVPRLRSEDGKVRLVNPPWAGVVSGFTMLFEALVLTMMKHMPVKPISLQLNMTEHKIWAIAKKYVETCRADEDFSDIEAIGVDETAQKRNHNYISLFVDLAQRRTIFIEEGKSSAVIKAFSEELRNHKGEPSQIKDVSCDMSPAFIKGIKENLPSAKITFDKFHLIKIINKGIDDIRKAEVRNNPILKNNRFLFLKNKQNLKKEQLEKLDELCMPELNLKTARAYQYRENFKAIYDAKTEDEFVVLLKKWHQWAMQSDLIEIVNFAKTIEDHWDGIVEWKRSQINNGILEGLNSVIQAAKAKARGFSNFEYFKIVAYLITGKLDFTRINTYCVPT